MNIDTYYKSSVKKLKKRVHTQKIFKKLFRYSSNFYKICENLKNMSIITI